MAFRTGADVADEAAKAAKAAAGKRFAQLEWFSIKEKDPQHFKNVRFVTDLPGWITVKMHNNQPTRPAPVGHTGNWPQRMSAVCRRDEDPKTHERTFPDHADCYFCDEVKQKGGKHDGKPVWPIDRTWGIGIERVEDGTKNADGSPHLVDKMVEVTRTIDGKEETALEPCYLLFVMSYGNFWGILHGIGQMRGTVVDRDFRITRTGFEMNDTEYRFSPFDPQMCTMPDSSQRQFDMRDPEILAYYDIPDLGEQVERQASDDYYDRFFDVRHAQPTSKGTTGEQTTAPSPDIQTPSGDVSPEQLASLVARVSGIQGATPVTPVTQPMPPEQPAVQPVQPVQGTTPLRPV